MTIQNQILRIEDATHKGYCKYLTREQIKEVFLDLYKAH